ncbi:hypothetical protein [Lentibacillus jeotgali]|uniref:hypothetical protein n=1 Tax=Lentibacillus jeotgali TaxID=558169 RepID=UPI0002D671C6|nr:hypothetical protein [Lentibacillus jeotgali]
MTQLTVKLEQLKNRLYQSSANERKPDNKRWMDEDIGEMTRLKFKKDYDIDIDV